MEADLNKCVWMWAGVLTYRLCDRDYQCDGCPVEQLFRAQGSKRVEPSRAESSDAALLPQRSIHPDRFHDAQHLWLRILPAGRVQVGLDPLASRLLLSSESLRVAVPGTRLARGEAGAAASLGGEEIRFASPLTGEVLRTHRVRPGRIRSMLAHPYSRAWLFILSAPRLGQQLSSFLFGRNAGLRLTQEWSAIQEECLGLASRTAVMPGALPDGGVLDLERLGHWAGPAYPRLVRRWIGMERIQEGRSGSRASAGERANEGGADAPPEGR